MQGDVRRSGTRGTGYIQIIGFFVRVVSEGGGDGTRHLRLLICLVDDMRSFGRPCQKSLSYSFTSSTLFHLFKLTSVAVIACGVLSVCRYRAENGGVLTVKIGDCKRKQVRGGVVSGIRQLDLAALFDLWSISRQPNRSCGLRSLSNTVGKMITPISSSSLTSFAALCFMPL